MREKLAIEHEDGLALFVSPEWRRRFRESLASERRRTKVIQKLAHFNHLDYRYASEVKSNRQMASVLGPELRRRGAGDRCHVVSEDGDFDGRDMALADALREIVDEGSTCAAFISCVPGKLAYFHDEEIGHRYILDRSIKVANAPG